MATSDLPYDFEDFGMTEDELRIKYPSGHPTYTISDWAAGPAFTHDSNGYWDWAMINIARDDEETPSTVEPE